MRQAEGSLYSMGPSKMEASADYPWQPTQPGDQPTCRGSWSARKEPMRLQESPPIQPRRNHRDRAWSILPILQALMYWLWRRKETCAQKPTAVIPRGG